MKKKKKRIKKPKAITYPTQLVREDYFKCPIWFADAPKFEKKLNNASDKYIEKSKKTLKPAIDKRNKEFGNKGDMGHVFHSTTLIGDKNFKEIQEYVGATAHNLLIEMGFDLTNHQVFTTEMWVQEFAKKGGGHHALHTLFEDPRAGNVMNLLPEADKSKVTYASSAIHYKVKPGSMIFFPSYMPHQYVVDMGYEPFRFIHWNCQAFPKGILNV